ncbi:hypothetical protein D3C86_2078210 [compost metagenome]
MVTTAQVAVRLREILTRVLTVFRGLPHVQGGPRQGVATSIAHVTGDQRGAARNQRHVFAVFPFGHTAHVERPEHRALRSLYGTAVLDGVD